MNTYKPVTAESAAESIKALARLYDEPEQKPKPTKPNMDTNKRLTHDRYFRLRSKLDPTAPECFANLTDRELADLYAKELDFPISPSSIKEIRKDVFGIDDPPRKTTNGGRLVRLEHCIVEIIRLHQDYEAFSENECERLNRILRGEDVAD